MKTFAIFAALALGCSKPDTTNSNTLGTTADTASDETDAPSNDTASSDDSGEPDDDTGEPIDPEPPEFASVFVIEGSNTDADWRDMAFLAAVPASSEFNGGAPAVLMAENTDSLSTPTLDLLRRLSPEKAYVMGGGAPIVHAETTVGMGAEDAQDWSIQLAESFWANADYAVVVSETDYSAAVLGASLAARLGGPLLIYSDDAAAVEAAAIGLSSEALTLGVDESPPSLPSSSTELNGIDATLDWLVAQHIDVPYLTVSNTNDRLSGRSQKASMVAPMYAANRAGLSLPIRLDMPTTVIDDGGDHPVLPVLGAAYERLGGPPDYLAIVGAHDALPQMRKPTIFDNPLNEQPVSDLPYGQIDADAFLDIAIGRIVGDSAERLSSTATRTAQYDRLIDGVWERNFVEAGLWGFDELRSMTTNVGFNEPTHMSESEIDAASSLEVSAFLHKDHSYCQVLGHAYDINSTALFAPAITVSRGCSVGGMDMLREDQRSIVDHLFGQGIVAFVGAARNAIAYNTIIEVSMWNQLLAGHTLGHSFKHGINDAIVHWLDDGSSAMRYSIDIEIVYGDPAFKLHVPGSYETEPAHQQFDGTTLTVNAPEEWTLVPYHADQLAEWGYEGDLYMYTAPGAIPRTYWAGSYDREDMYFGVQLHLDEAPISVQQAAAYPSPLGWDDGYHIDDHPDGTASVMWRVRLLDFEPLNGIISAEAPSFSYSVE